MESTMDPESGMFHKGEKEKCFAYTVTVACDRNSFVLGLKATLGMYMTVKYFPMCFQKVIEKHPEIEAVVVDAWYKTPAICREIIKPAKTPLCFIKGR